MVGQTPGIEGRGERPEFGGVRTLAHRGVEHDLAFGSEDAFFGDHGFVTEEREGRGPKADTHFEEKGEHLLVFLVWVIAGN